MSLFPRFSLGRNPRRAGVCRAAAEKRTVRLMYITISRVPTKCSCKTQSRGSARPSPLQDQVTLQASILRSHLQDDREPRPTKPGRPRSSYPRLNARVANCEGHKLQAFIPQHYPLGQWLVYPTEQLAPPQNRYQCLGWRGLDITVEQSSFSERSITPLKKRFIKTS